MKELWSKIGFTPDTFELVDENDKTDALIIDKERFPRLAETPKPKQADLDKYSGITVRNIPSALTDEEILSFLTESGVPEDTEKANVKIIRGPKNSSATAEGIEPEKVIKITETLDFPQSRTKFFNVPLYCRPLRIQSPVKDSKVSNQTALPTPNLSPSKSASTELKKTPSPIYIVGGVSFKDTTTADKLKDFVFAEDPHKNTPKQKPTPKRSSLNMSPLENMKDSKLVKT